MVTDDYKKARGAVPGEPGMISPEEAIRRGRGAPDDYDGLRAEVEELRGLLTRFVAINTDADHLIRNIERNLLFPANEDQTDEFLSLMDEARKLIEPLGASGGATPA